MFARVRITSGVPDKVDDGIRHFRENVVASYTDVAGFKGAYLLVNRNSGKVMGITLWDSETNMQATGRTSEKLRAAGSQVVSGTTPPPEEYEVVVQPQQLLSVRTRAYEKANPNPALNAAAARPRRAS